MMEIKGIAHINFSVRDFKKSLPFYKALFAQLGLKEMIVTDDYYYCVGRIGMGIQQCSPDFDTCTSIKAAPVYTTTVWQ